ncbi:MAG: hydrogenase maturation nickel metallochaperone HypA [Candidatus Zixiibacteriota bacterium]|nr:MAG: hydrogenase maturation nickel metallochaperone HypA [candidate division Zixibacteria bacterium]
MHEFSLLHDLLEKIEVVAEENGSDQVIGVKVRLGALAHISPSHLREHFDHAVVGTVAEGARLDIEELKDEHDPHAQEIILDSIEVAEM